MCVCVFYVSFTFKFLFILFCVFFRYKQAIISEAEHSEAQADQSSNEDVLGKEIFMTLFAIFSVLP